MSLFGKKIPNIVTENDIDNSPFFSSVALDGVNILTQQFEYKGETYSGLFPPPYKELLKSGKIANFRNPASELIYDTNFTDPEVYSLGLINNSSQYNTGDFTPTDEIHSDIIFTISCTNTCSLSIIAGTLPTGLTFNDYGNNIGVITGEVSNIDTSKLYYDFVVRAYSSTTNLYSDRYFRLVVDPDIIGISWDTSWLSSLDSVTGTNEYDNVKVYPLVYSANIITNIYALLHLNNPYGLDVTYDIVSNSLTQNNDLIPNGITLDQSTAVFRGIPTKNNLFNQYYFFSVRASVVYNGNIITGTKEADTTDTIFYFYIDDSQDNITNTNNYGNITWITDSNLGYVYEQQPLYFNVEATTTNDTTITYTLVSSTLSAGMSLTSDGYITGLSTFTNNKNQTITFTVKASDGYTTSTKNFYFVILGQHSTNDLLSISFPLFHKNKNALKELIYDPNIVPDDAVFRLNVDDNFGRVENYEILLVDSLNSTDVEEIENNLYQYYKPFKLRFGDFGYGKVNDANGNYIYDVIYINIIDENDNGNAFDNGVEQIYYDNTNSLKYGAPIWNIPTGNYSKTRIFPTNLYNMRQNLILTTNREGYQDNNATDEYQTPTGYTRGVGVDGTETLPDWMRSVFSGWGEAIALVYVNKGYGETILNNINNDNRKNNILGVEITLDRFSLNSRAFSFTLFDVKSTDYTELGNLTSFDSCANMSTENVCYQLYPNMLTWTEFDSVILTNSYYIKFPPGDTY